MYTVITEYSAQREVEVEASTPEEALELAYKELPTARFCDPEPTLTLVLDEDGEIVLEVDE